MEKIMPRGAIPVSRSELAASEPYQPDSEASVDVPSGAFPSPNQELAAARPFHAVSAAPESFLFWPSEEFRDFAEGEQPKTSMWVEEAFAKACVEPKVSIPVAAVLSAERECGTSNFSRFMQTRGFQVNGKAYLDGPFNAVNWKDTALLQSAIATAGPVKAGVASASLASCPHGRLTPGKSGWAIYGLQAGQPGDHCISLCGYGSLPALVRLFAGQGVTVNVPPAMPAELCYAVFTAGSMGIVDGQSLADALGEAWVRTPTTLAKDLPR